MADVSPFCTKLLKDSKAGKCLRKSSDKCCGKRITQRGQKRKGEKQETDTPTYPYHGDT